MSEAMEAVSKVIEELEEELKEEKITSNRLRGEIIRMKASVKSLIDLFDEGEKICNQLRM